MIELLSTMSGTQVMITSVLILLALKEVISLGEFFDIRIRKRFEGEAEVKNGQDEVIDKINNLYSKLDEYHNDQLKFYGEFNDFKEDCSKRFEQQESQLKLLTESDRDDIKGWLVEKHDLCIEKGFIDNFTLEVVEKRFDHYKEEGGNSFAETLVSDMRMLPRKER